MKWFHQLTLTLRLSNSSTRLLSSLLFLLHFPLISSRLNSSVPLFSPPLPSPPLLLLSSSPSPSLSSSSHRYQSWIFKPRLTEADSRSYYDDGVLDAMFALDWDRATNSAKFQKVRSLYVRNVL